MKTGVFKVVTLGLIICFVLSAGCAKLPEEGSTTQSASSESGSSSAAGGETDQVTYSTPISTETESDDKPKFSTPPEEDYSGPQYSVIYSKEDELKYTVIPFDLELTHPPLIFEYELEIETYEVTKAGESSYGSKTEYTYEQDLPNPNAWYTISVYNSETAELIDSEELKQFGDTSVSGEFKIYEAGNLHIEISGNLLTANTTVKVPPENLE